jgi:predicted Zn-dependent protease with MMP-like domain
MAGSMDARHWKKLTQIAEAETSMTLQRLPPDLRERAAGVPLVFEPWVGEELLAPDLEPDILGLFVGDPHSATESTLPLPPQIFLFLESIWDLVEGDEAAFREEVRLTFLHELGHYLGLDEGELEDRGLE